MMQISVIIPVYNASDFVSKAVQSALTQPQTAEVILIEDGSTDDSFAVCLDLAKQDERVKVYHHPNRDNLGASATRNLGIEKSCYPYIAFLDADDYFLPDRFKVTQATFNQYPDADGVYDAVDMEFIGADSQARWTESGRTAELTTLRKNVAPDDLLEALIFDRYGAFHTDGLTVKRDVFERSGLFDGALRLHQDTALWLKMSATSRLYGGQITQPVAIRRVHLHNRISAKRSASQIHHHQSLMAETVWRWADNHPDLTHEQKALFLEYYLRRAMAWHDPEQSALQRLLKGRSLLVQLLVKHPQLAFKSQYWIKFLPSAYH